MKKIVCFLLLAFFMLGSLTACTGKDGITPTFEISEDGFWIINDSKTEYKAVGVDGKDGITPTIEINEDGYWVINGEITNVKATSEDVVDENPQELDFYKQDDGTYVVSVGRAKYHSNVVIPETYNGAKVVALDDYAFRQCTHISSVIIPNSVTSIGEMAFAHCYDLSSVIIPDSVTTIADMAFTSCTKLNDVFYTGSEDEWASIIIGSMNNELTNATIHYNYVPEE